MARTMWLWARNGGGNFALIHFSQEFVGSPDHQVAGSLGFCPLLLGTPL